MSFRPRCAIGRSELTLIILRVLYLVVDYWRSSGHTDRKNEEVGAAVGPWLELVPVIQESAACFWDEVEVQLECVRVLNLIVNLPRPLRKLTMHKDGKVDEQVEGEDTASKDGGAAGAPPAAAHHPPDKKAAKPKAAAGGAAAPGVVEEAKTIFVPVQDVGLKQATLANMKAQIQKSVSICGEDDNSSGVGTELVVDRMHVVKGRGDYELCQGVGMRCQLITGPIGLRIP